MQYRNDPKSGNALSVLGFGCMRFPRDTDKTEQLILSAIQKGVNYFDTAYIYGNSETVLGEILHKNHVREKIYLATKLPHYKCKSYDDFDRYFAIQLKRLQTGYIDYYLIHNLPDLAAWTALCKLGIQKWIAEKKERGQIRQLGFSFHGAQAEFFSLLDAYAWDFCQIQYNYMNETYQAGRAGLQKAHKKGLPVIIMEPLLGGKLANGLPPKAAKAFRELNSERSAASWALRWLWHQAEVTLVLSGMNSEAQLADNLQTAGEAKTGMLSDREAAVFEPVREALREAYKIPCTGCNYCLPCPQGVNIPGCFAAYNSSHSFGYFAGLTQYITGTGSGSPENSSRAKKCAGCGACVKKCPQHIDIPKSIHAVTKRLEPFWYEPLLWLVRKIIG